MKKFFALVLAVAMIMSMSAVSFAADTTVELAGPFDYSADSDAMTYTGLKYGDTVYYLLILDDAVVTDYEIVEKLKIKAEFEMGEDLVNDVVIEKKKINEDATKGWKGVSLPVELFNNGWPNGYMYFVGIKTVAKETTSDADIIGTLEFNRKAIKDMKGAAQSNEIDEVELPVEVNIFYSGTDYFGTDYVGTSLNNISGDIKLDWDESYVLKFDCDDEIEISFGTDPNEGTFTVDVSGQGKLFVKYNTKAVDAIVDANPGVKMHFVNFNDVKFNRTGEFSYELEDGVAAYKVVDGALVAIPGLEVDDGEFTFNTRTLGSYVFADAELVSPAVAAPVAPEAVTNPTTGA